MVSRRALLLSVASLQGATTIVEASLREVPAFVLFNLRVRRTSVYVYFPLECPDILVT